MSYDITRAAVIGAGIMGAGIAAHLANAGIPTTLLDIVPADARDSRDGAARNRITQAGLDRAVKARPASAFYDTRSVRLITVGNVEDDFARVGEADWIVEAVIEELDAKRATYARIEEARKAGSIVSSNTSGLPAHLLMEGRGADLRRHFLITHFFNPVRFMKLLELAPDPDTDPEIMRYMAEFGTERLGKGVVLCKDTPNFIGNRIGTYGFMVAVKRMLDEGFKIEEVDAILGPAMGRPKSAVFRTADLAGVDTLVHVADNLYENLPNDPQRETFRTPDFIRGMIERRWLGDKTGQGFYRKFKGADGESEILALDPATMQYRAQDSVHFSSIDAAKGADESVDRVRALLAGGDRASRYAWEVTADTLLYTAAVTPEIAHDVPSVDNAMRWGYAWDLGPFETWDALGVEALAKRMTGEGRTLPPLVERVLGDSRGRFYTAETPRSYFDFATGGYAPEPARVPALALAPLKRAGKVVKENRSASAIDLGDGVLGVEFHSKLNAIDDDLIALVGWAVDEAERGWRALVLGNEAPDFCVGANLAQVLMAARMRQFPLIDRATRALQQANLRLKYCQVPTVVAPAGRALGGGCEFVLHGQHVRAAAETYLGQVEVGVGLIPAGGGCKEMLARWADLTPEHGPFGAARHAFEILAVGTVSTSAAEARGLGFLRKTDGITLDRERLLADARADALALAERKDRGEWRPPEPPTFRLPGAGGRLVLEQVADNLRLQGKASEHDALVAGKLAYVLTGGDCSPLDVLTEQQILDLERETFLSLCGTVKTQQRMEYTLKTGKPLRN
jgi:3-hydroxyacyl-CoA dehydrogenase